MTTRVTFLTIASKFTYFTISVTWSTNSYEFSLVILLNRLCITIIANTSPLVILNKSISTLITILQSRLRAVFTCNMAVFTFVIISLELISITAALVSYPLIWFNTLLILHYRDLSIIIILIINIIRDISIAIISDFILIIIIIS
jgi:hypothetical protein